MNNDRSFEIRENVFTYTPVPAAAFGSGWGYTPPLQYTRQISSQFSIIRKVFLLIFRRISISHLCETRNRHLYIQRKHTIMPTTTAAPCIRAHYFRFKNSRVIYIGKSKRLQQIIVYTSAQCIAMGKQKQYVDTH